MVSDAESRAEYEWGYLIACLVAHRTKFALMALPPTLFVDALFHCWGQLKTRRVRCKRDSAKTKRGVSE